MTPKLHLANFLQHALMEMGVEEFSGDQTNPRILQYHMATELKATEDEVPWCAAFACFIIEKLCGVKSTRSALARSYESWGEELLNPIPGCVVVLSRGSNPTFGHVCFFIHETRDHILCVGGNQNDKVSITSYPKSRVVSYRTVSED